MRILNSFLIKDAHIALPLVKSKAQGLCSWAFLLEFKMGIAKQLANKLDTSEAEVTALLLRAPLHYKVYKIPKRTFGERTIAQPSAALKALQRAFLMLQPLPTHQAAMAYRPGLSIKDNAHKHRKNSYLLKVDLNNFFNSIEPQLFWQEWSSLFELPEPNEKTLIERLLFWAPRKNLQDSLILSVGAPSSPSVSNFVMRRFDTKLDLICRDKKVVYTRYADDLTFSTQRQDVLGELPALIAELLRECFGAALTINRRKTVLSSKAHNRHVTGITLANSGQLSLGRQRKRYIKHLVHQFILEQLAPVDINHLQGLLSFAKHIEPVFIQALEKKYGPAALAAISGVNHD